MHSVRQPAVAGAFYPGQGQALASTVASLLATARSQADSVRDGYSDDDGAIL